MNIFGKYEIYQKKGDEEIGNQMRWKESLSKELKCEELEFVFLGRGMKYERI